MFPHVTAVPCDWLQWVTCNMLLTEASTETCGRPGKHCHGSTRGGNYSFFFVFVYLWILLKDTYGYAAKSTTLVWLGIFDFSIKLNVEKPQHKFKNLKSYMLTSDPLCWHCNTLQVFPHHNLPKQTW